MIFVVTLFSFVTNSSILHDPPKLNDSSAHWQFETGIMGPATNIHILFESVRTNDGVSVIFFLKKTSCNSYLSLLINPSKT